MKRSFSALYFSIPFCNKICPFCSFAVIRDDPSKHSDYLDLIRQEFQLTIQDHPCDLSKIRSVYLGGGTPSRLSPGHLSSLVDWTHATFSLSVEVHWAIEVNPEDISLPYALELKRLGFSRVSIGVQSFQTEGLQQLGRIHHPHQSRNAINNLRKAGITDINLDLMFGYPDQTMDMLEEDINEYMQWDPSHISIYGLTIEEKTNFARKPFIRQWQAENEELISQMYETIVHSLTQHHMVHYEISNFAKPGYESLQNLIYWSGENYLGLGLGSHSLVAPYRWGNYKRWVDYRKSINEKCPPILEKEKLGVSEKMNEELMIRLRLSKGLNLKSFSSKFKVELEERWNNILQNMMTSELIKIQNDHLQLTVRGQLLADEITASLAALLP